MYPNLIQCISINFFLGEGGARAHPCLPPASVPDCRRDKKEKEKWLWKENENALYNVEN
jgi:hypothetical protein